MFIEVNEKLLDELKHTAEMDNDIRTAYQLLEASAEKV